MTNKNHFPIETVIEMTEQVPVTKKSDTEKLKKLLKCLNMTEGNKRWLENTEPLEENTELGEFEADIREESVKVIEEEHEEQVQNKTKKRKK
jgi:hypothetical protein